MIAYSGKPDGPPIASIRAERMSWPAALAELVDNSFDAGARRVEVMLEPHGFIVRDDGRGVDNLSRLLKFGDHHAHATTRLGRYGIGAKEVIFRGNLVRIETVHAGQRYELQIDVSSVMDWDALEGADPVPVDEPPGTIIEVRKIPRDIARITETPIREKLSLTFAPAISGGRQILLGSGKAETTPVAAWTPPLLKSVIEGEHKHEDGRTFTYRAGLLADPAPRLRGTWVAYAHRYLDHSKLGFEVSPGARVHVQIHLHEKRYGLWRLEKHKRELFERQKEELAEVLGDILLPLFAADEAEEQDIKVDGANAILDAAFGQDGGTSTPRPGPGQQPGGKFGKGDGDEAPAPPKKERPKRAAKTEKTRRPLSRGLRVRRDHLGEEAVPFQYTQAKHRSTIIFNADHVLWKQIEGDEVAIAREALFIYTHSRADTRAQRSYFGLLEEHLTSRAKEFGRLLRGIK